MKDYANTKYTQHKVKEIERSDYEPPLFFHSRALSNPYSLSLSLSPSFSTHSPRAVIHTQCLAVNQKPSQIK